jgi:hypothetical protein
MFALEADSAAYGGQAARARELARSAVDSAERAVDKEHAAFYQAWAAMREALAGNNDLAKQLAEDAGVVGNRPIYSLAHLGAARAYALACDPARARGAYQYFLALCRRPRNLARLDAPHCVGGPLLRALGLPV